MKTMQAEYRTDIARLAEQIAQRDARAAERLASSRGTDPGVWTGIRKSG